MLWGVATAKLVVDDETQRGQVSDDLFTGPRPPYLLRIVDAYVAEVKEGMSPFGIYVTPAEHEKIVVQARRVEGRLPFGVVLWPSQSMTRHGMRPGSGKQHDTLSTKSAMAPGGSLAAAGRRTSGWRSGIWSGLGCVDAAPGPRWLLRLNLRSFDPRFRRSTTLTYVVMRAELKVLKLIVPDPAPYEMGRVGCS